MEPTSPSRRLLWWLTRSKGRLQGYLNRLARGYTHAFHDYSYDCRLNGEQTLLQKIAHVDPRVIFDVGANVGEWTTLAARICPQAVIHAFELSADIRRHLRNRVAEARVHIPDVALGDRNGEASYKDFGGCSGLNTLVTATTHHDWRSPSIRLGRVMRGDMYCSEAGVTRIDLLKVDVEGFEGPVLVGFGDMLHPERVRCIQFEYGYGNGDIHWLMKDFVDFLQAKGYVVGKLWHDGVSLQPFEYAWNNFESGPNYVAFGREDVALNKGLVRRGDGQ
jgi:FkbM family methyltransferase